MSEPNEYRCPKCKTVITAPHKVFASDIHGEIIDIKIRAVEYDCTNPECELYHRTTLVPKKKGKK